MSHIRRFVPALSAAALMAGLLASAPSVSADKMKLVGCLVQSEGDDGYLLINPPLEPGPGAGDGAVAPGSVGTAPVAANVFYWLDKDDDLKPHVGHRVEIEGNVNGDVKRGEIEIDRKDGWTEIEVKSAGREMKARVPNASVIAGPHADREIDVLVRRVDVDKVRMLDAACR
jgi:hypothetical protein